MLAAVVGTRPRPDPGTPVRRRHAGALRSPLPPLWPEAAASLYPAEGVCLRARAAGHGRQLAVRRLGRAVGRA
eukprot:7503827-Pyramimonas_sp.AAC.1